MDIRPTDFNANRILHLIRNKREAFWSRERERRALMVFHEAARRVPAYKDFLKKNNIQPDKIKTFKDFELVPPTSKKNYLRQYPLEKLCWDGSLKKPLVLTATSGSTGEPFYFFRDEDLHWQASLIHELFLKNSSYNSGGPTLIIVGFGMGVWIGGLMTYKAFEIAGQRGKYPISIITPGINKKEIFHAIKRLAPHYKEIILTGYAPFIKDIIDEADEWGINIKKLNLRILTAAESYTEKFRDYLVKKAGVKNCYVDTLNIYGTAEIGAMAWETPTTILIRRLAMKNEKLFQEIFSPLEKTPTLAQYNPLCITFEVPAGEILLTGNSAVPFVRYAIGDRGGVLSYGEAAAKLKRYGIHIQQEAKCAGVPELYRLPLVFVYERIDFSTTLYGLQIYPETIRETLLDKQLSKYVTSKFTMRTKFGAQQDQYLEINVELKKDKKADRTLRKITLEKIVFDLRMKNSEFRELHHHLGKRANPKLIFWPHEHPLYFKPGVKQKWVKK